jgi:hypothetical protein
MKAIWLRAGAQRLCRVRHCSKQKIRKERSHPPLQHPAAFS